MMKNHFIVVKETKDNTHQNKAPYNGNIKGRLQSLRSQFSPRKSLTTRKRVKFSKDKPQIIPTLSRSDFTVQEFQSYWFQHEEMKALIDRNWLIIDAYEKAKKNKQPEFNFCTRGLESYILERKRGKEIHATKRKNAYTAVLLWGRGLKDEEMARRYQLVSKRCVKRAIEYARRDEMTAKRILKEENSSTSTSQRSERSLSSISTRSSLDIPCIPKRRNTRSGTTGKASSPRKQDSQSLRPNLKSVHGSIPHILPEIYVRSTPLAGTNRKRLQSRHGTLHKSKISSPEGKSNKVMKSSPLKKHHEERMEHRIRTVPLSRLPIPPMLNDDDNNHVEKKRTVPRVDLVPRILMYSKIDDNYFEIVSQLIHGKLPMSPSAKALTSAKVIFSKLKVEGPEEELSTA